MERMKTQVVKPRVAIKKVSEKKKIEKAQEKIETKKLHEWFLKIWDKTEDANGYCYCYETHTPMHRSIFRTNTCCYHHPLEKSKYPQFAMQEWNILIVLPDVHSQTHSNSDKTPRIKNYTSEFLEKI